MINMNHTKYFAGKEKLTLKNKKPTDRQDKFGYDGRCKLCFRWGVIVFMALLCFMAMVGCTAKKTNLNQELSNAVARNSYPRSIAVLPFGNRTEVEGLEDFVRVTFYSHMCAHPYRDIELQLVDQKLRERKITDFNRLRKMSVRKLGRILGCDAVIFGEVNEFGRIFAGIYSQMAVGASITIWDTRTGRKIWEDEYVERHHEGGIPLTLTDVPMIAVRSGMNLRESAKIQAVDELSRQLTKNIPVPEIFSYSYSTMADSDSLGDSKYKSLKRLTKSNDRLVYSTKFKSLKKLTKKDTTNTSSDM